MTEKLDFFGASRIVAGTDRRVRYTGDNSDTLSTQIMRKWSTVLEDGSLMTTCADCSWDHDYWWPTFEQQKEKAWEVEPEKPKETFMWRARRENGEYYFREDRLSISYKHLQTAQKYRLVPVDQSITEIEDGLSRVRWAEGLILQLPKTHKGRNSWLLNFGVKEEALNFRRTHVDKLKTLGYEIEELIWSEKTQSLLPVGEKSSTSVDQPLWPWKKFVADDMPKKLFKFLAIMETGDILFDWWVNKPRQGGLWRPDILEIMLIKYYCRVSKIPIPEEK